MAKENTIDAAGNESLARKWEEITGRFTKAKVTIDTDAPHLFPGVSQLKLAGCLAYFYNNRALPANPSIEITEGAADISITNRIAILSGNFSATDATGRMLISNGRLIEPFELSENDLPDGTETNDSAGHSKRRVVTI